MRKKILLGLLAVLVIIQFIRPSKNEGELIPDTDISKVYATPKDVHAVLVKKCYDCHSNHTVYHWYYNIQPIGWWMASHINDGKRHLNYAEFKNYDDKRKAHKLEETSEAVTEGWMPLSSYLWIHKNAKLEPRESDAINAWIKSLNLPAED
jgi:hypothetical protein